MSDIKNKLWYTDEEIAEVEGKMGRPGFASTWSYAVISNLLSDRRNFITTIESQNGELEALNKAHHVWLKRHVNYKEQIESQKEEIERLQIDRSDWEEEYMSLKRRFEDLDKSALETLELLNGPNEQIESLKAITELAVSCLKEISDGGSTGEDARDMRRSADYTLSEIERLQNG